MDIYFWKCTILSVSLGYFQLYIVGNLTNCIKTVLAPVSEASRDEISNGSSLKRAQLLSLSLSQLCSPPCVTFILWLTSPAAAAVPHVTSTHHAIHISKHLSKQLQHNRKKASFLEALVTTIFMTLHPHFREGHGDSPSCLSLGAQSVFWLIIQWK